MLNFTITLSIQEGQTLLNAINSAIKVDGLSSAMTLCPIAGKLQAAGNAAVSAAQQANKPTTDAAAEKDAAAEESQTTH